MKKTPQNCVFYQTKIHGTALKQPIRIEYLIKQKPRGALAVKQVPAEQDQSINQIKYISLPNKKYSNRLVQCYHEYLSTNL